MIFSKPLTACLLIGCLINLVVGTAYEININGQTYQVNVVNAGGETYNDRTIFSDDYGQLLDEQKDAICSSLRGEYCEQVTNNGAKTHNLFNYFPNHASESIVAHANNRFNKDESPYLLKQSLDDRTLQYLSRQNPHFLGTKPIKPRTTQNTVINNINDITQTLLESVGNNNNDNHDPLKRIGSKKIKYKNRKKQKIDSNKNKDNNKASEKEGNREHVAREDNDGNDDEYSDVEVELYSNLNGDTELANALGLDDDEFGETVDRIVAQLVASYVDNDSDEVDASQIFANALSVENGDVSTEQINLDDASMQEMNELLNTIAKKHKKKKIKKKINNAEITNGDDNDDDVDDNGNEEDQETQIFALKFVVESDNDDNNNNDDDDGNDKVEEEQQDDLF